MAEKGIDCRIAANFVLHVRGLLGLKTTQIELQKLLFLAHEAYLVRCRERLISGYFEAWRYGPVHPEIYSCVKKFGRNPITEPLRARDPFSGVELDLVELQDLDAPEAKSHIMETVAKYAKMSASQLIELTHLPGGAWDVVVQSANKGVALGLRIGDDVILGCRVHHRLMREGRSVVKGDICVDEEVPLAGHRSG